MDSTLLDVSLADCFPLAEAADHWPAGSSGRRLVRTTFWRYATTGVAGVKLQTLRVPGIGRMTCRRWIEQFVARVNAARTAS